MQSSDPDSADSVKLSDFGIDARRGLLPAQDPLQCLAEPVYGPWEELGNELPQVLLRDDFRSVLHRLPLLDISGLRNAAEYERAFLLLSLFANAYIFGAGRRAVTSCLPRNLAVPFCQVAARLERPPIFSYPTVFHNWRLHDPASEISFANLACLHTFTCNPSEEQFWRVLLEMEYIFAPGLFSILELRRAMRLQQNAEVQASIKTLLRTCDELKIHIQKMPSRCDIHGWVYALVPYLSGWNEFSSHAALKDGLVYEGVSAERRKCNSATAAQSPIFQLLDALIAVEHGKKTRPFLGYMAESLHPGHRRLLRTLLQGPSLQQYVLTNASDQSDQSDLVELFGELVHKIIDLRHTHFIIANEFLQRRYLDEKQQAFLSKSIGETRVLLTPLMKFRRQLHQSIEPASPATEPAAAAPKETRWTVVYASQTGSATLRALDLFSLLQRKAPAGVTVQCIGMDQYDLEKQLQMETVLLIVTSTYGDGHPPVMGERFREQLQQLTAAGLQYPVQYAVFGLGSSLYANYCQFAKEADGWLSQLGGQRLSPLMTDDSVHRHESGYEEWKSAVVRNVLGENESLPPPAPAPRMPPIPPHEAPDAGKCAIPSGRAKKIVVLLDNGSDLDASAARHLLASPNYRLRVFSDGTTSAKLKSLLSQDCEVISGDRTAPDSLARGFAGAHAVVASTDFFAIGEAAELAQGKRLVDAALAAGVRHFLWSSMEDCAVPQFRAKAAVARYARANKLPLTELVPASLFDDFLTIYAPRRAADGSLVLFLPPGAASRGHEYVAADDLGGWIRACLEAPDRYLGRSVPMCSARVSLHELAAAITATTGERCRAEPVTTEQLLRTQAFGPLTRMYCALWDHLNASPERWRDADASRSIYPQAMTLRQWLEAHGGSLGSRFCGPYA